MFSKRLIPLIGLLLLPTIALAKQADTWDFSNNQVPGSWQVGGWTQQPVATPNGLHILAAQDGQMIRDIEEPFSVDAVEITLVNPRASQLYLLWDSPDLPAGSLAQFPVTINGDPLETVSIDASTLPGWYGRTGKLGIGFPAGSDVTVQSITLEHWDWLEKIGYAWQSFWTFDKMQDYSINFLWGPLLATNPAGMATLFATLPPHAHSVDLFFYVLIGVVALGLVLHRFYLFFNRRHIPRFPFSPLRHVSVHLGILVCLVAGLFVLYDVRMGLEYMSYAKTDYDTYVGKPMGQRTFRGFLNLYDVLTQSAPLLQQEKGFGFFTPPHTESRIRYYAYPAKAIQNAGPDAGVRMWLVFERPDVTVDARGELTVGGEVVSKPGKIVQQYSARSFLFETL